MSDDVLVITDTVHSVLELVSQGPQGIPGRLWRPPVQVTYAASVNLDCTSTDTFDILLTGDINISLSNAVDGQRILLRLKQNSAGNHVATWGIMVKFGSDILSVTLSPSANATDNVGFIYRGAAGFYDLVGFARGY